MVAVQQALTPALALSAQDGVPVSDERDALIERARSHATEERLAVEALGALLADLGAERWAAVLDGDILASSSSVWDELSEEEAAVCAEALRVGGFRGPKRGDDAGRWWRAVAVKGRAGLVVLVLMRGGGRRPPSVEASAFRVEG